MSTSGLAHVVVELTGRPAGVMDSSKTNIIVGPPGTGKTTRLLQIVERSLESGVKPYQIGFVSFTKKAAEEGKSRAMAKFALTSDDLPHFKTLHAFAFRYLGMRRDQVLSWAHVRELGRSLGIDFKGRGDVADDDVYGMNSADRMLFLEGLARNSRRSLKDIWNEAFEDAIDWWELERFAKGLDAFKKKRMLSDYTDMLERFCFSSPKTLPQFEVLIIDEAQDLSQLQWEAVELLAQNAKRIYVAGDDDQAIYKWSGADVERFIGLEGTIQVLDHSYRIPSTVFTFAESISSKISKRRPKKWESRSEVGAVNWYGDMEEIDLSKDSWLLLARNGYMLDKLEDWCLSQGFSFNSVNRDPLKSPALAAIRTWETLRRGKDDSAEHILDMLKYMHPALFGVDLVKKLKADKTSNQYGMPELTTNGLRTQKIWHECLTKISPKERDFFIAARRRGEPLLKEPRIKISTIHAAKGGEADHVLLLTDMSYRCYNNMQNNFDDEARVWYVAATRCMKSLNLIMPKTNLSFDL